MKSMRNWPLLLTFFFIFPIKIQNSYGKLCDRFEKKVNISQKWKKVEKVEGNLKRRWNFGSESVNRTIREDTNQKLFNFFERIFFLKIFFFNNFFFRVCDEWVLKLDIEAACAASNKGCAAPFC